MRTAEEIIGLSFYPHECGSMIDCVTKQDAIKAINEAREEAIRECADKINSLLQDDGTVYGDTLLKLINQIK